MAQKSWPFHDGSNGTPVGEDEWSIMARAWATSGVVRETAASLQVTADGTGMQVTVKPGRATLRGHWYVSDANETLPIAANATGNPRLDRVVLRLDPAANKISLAVKTGTAAAAPQAPALTQTDLGVFEIPLGRVAVAPGGTAIASGAITDERVYQGLRAGDATLIDDGAGWVMLSAPGTNIQLKAGASRLLLTYGGGVRIAPTTKPTDQPDTVATKGYVDERLPIAGGTITGELQVLGKVSGPHPEDGDLVLHAPTGQIVVLGPPGTPASGTIAHAPADYGNQSATLAQVHQAAQQAADAALPRAGGTITGDLAVQGTTRLGPVNLQDATTPATEITDETRWLVYKGTGRVAHVPKGTFEFYIRAVVAASTSRLKRDIAPARDVPDITALTPSVFNWADPESREAGPRLGLIAEEAAALDERLVLRDPDGEVSGLDTHALIAALIAKVTDLQTRLDTLT